MNSTPQKAFFKRTWDITTTIFWSTSILTSMEKCYHFYVRSMEVRIVGIARLTISKKRITGNWPVCFTFVLSDRPSVASSGRHSVDVFIGGQLNYDFL